MDNDHDAILIGLPGVERRLRETGQSPDARIDRVTLDADGLRGVVTSARAFFSGFLPDLERSYRRSRRHSGTPMRKIHRLAELAVAVDDNISSIMQGGRESDVLAALELSRAVDLYKRWSCDPVFPVVLKAARDPDNFRHDVTLLAAASVLADAGLGVELVPAGAGRSADLRIAISLHHALRAEVKAPNLDGEVGEGGLSERGSRLIRRSVRDAMEQVGRAEPGVVLVGGPFWLASQLDLVGGECRRYWERSGIGHRTVAAVLAVSTTAEALRRPETMHLPFDWSHLEFRPSLAARWVPNASYDGPVTLKFPNNFFGRFEVSFRPT